MRSRFGKQFRPTSGTVSGARLERLMLKNSGLDAQVTIENRSAYDAVQLGLILLNKCRIKGYVPAIEEQEFFPEFFTTR